MTTTASQISKISSRASIYLSSKETQGAMFSYLFFLNYLCNVEGHLRSNLPEKREVLRIFRTLDLVSLTRMDKTLDLLRINFKTEKSLDQTMAGRVNGNWCKVEDQLIIILTGRVDMAATTWGVATAVAEDMAASSMVCTEEGEGQGDVIRSCKSSNTSTSCWLSTSKYSSTPVGLTVV